MLRERYRISPSSAFRSLAYSQVLAPEVLCDFLVPQSDITRTIIDDRPQLRVLPQIRQKLLHTKHTSDEIRDSVFLPLRVQGDVHVLDGLLQDGRQPSRHDGVGEGVLVVSTESGPLRLVWVDTGGGSRELCVDERLVTSNISCAPDRVLAVRHIGNECSQTPSSWHPASV